MVPAFATRSISLAVGMPAPAVTIQRVGLAMEASR